MISQRQEWETKKDERIQQIFGRAGLKKERVRESLHPERQGSLHPWPGWLPEYHHKQSRDGAKGTEWSQRQVSRN